MKPWTLPLLLAPLAACGGGERGAARPKVEPKPAVDAGAPGYADAAERGCDRGDREACDALALALRRGWGRRRDVARALALLERVCSSGGFHSCVLLAEATLIEYPSDAPKKAEAIQLLHDTCGAGEAESCVLLAAPKRMEEDIETAIIEARMRVDAAPR